MTDAPTIPVPSSEPAELPPLELEALVLYGEVSEIGACLALRAARLPRSVTPR